MPKYEGEACARQTKEQVVSVEAVAPTAVIPAPAKEVSMYRAKVGRRQEFW